MGKIKDLIGQKFGKLLVIGNSKSKKICICDCGKVCEIDTNHLVSGHTKSCGCNNARYWKTALGLSKSRLYKCWQSMMSRCYSFNNIAYKYYGKRNITVCDEWHNSSNFLNWALNNGYADNLTLDRIDVNKNYSPENCRWITMKEQNRNTRRTIYIDDNNKKICLFDFCKKYNINYKSVLYYRKKYDMNTQKAIDKVLKKEG